MSDGPTLEDLLGLLGLGDTLGGVLAGTVTFTDARVAFDTSEDEWPAVPIDWVAVIAEPRVALDELRNAAAQQAAAVEGCNLALAAAAGEGNVLGVQLLPVPVDRLLTSEERVVVEEVPLTIAQIAGEFELRADAAEAEAEGFEQDAQELQDELGEGWPDDEDGDGG